MTAEDLIRKHRLIPHPEGGHYRETFRQRPAGGGRGTLTTILYLLRAGERSHWHRVTDAVEVWHFHEGDPLKLLISPDGRRVERHLLGPGGAHQLVVEPNVWQSAEPLGDWTLVGCAVAPAFELGSFEIAPLGWAPST